MRPQFSFWRTVKIAFTSFAHDFDKVLILAWKPFVVAYVATFLIGFIEGFARGFGVNLYVTNTLGVFVAAIFGSYFGLAMHRYRMMGWSKDTSYVSFRFRRRERLFLAVAAAYCLLAVLPFQIIPLLPLDLVVDYGVTGWCMLVLLATALIFSRLVFALPAIATDLPRPFGAGWILGRGAWVKIFFLLLVTVLPFVAISKLVTIYISNIYFQPVLLAAVGYVQSAVVIIAVCEAYKVRTNIGDSASAALIEATS